MRSLRPWKEAVRTSGILLIETTLNDASCLGIRRSIEQSDLRDIDYDYAGLSQTMASHEPCLLQLQRPLAP